MTNVDAAAALHDVAKRYWEHQCYEQPIVALLAGHPTHEVVLFRESLADNHRRYLTNAKFLTELAAITLADLEGQDRISHRLLERELRLARQLYEVKYHLQPTLFPFGPHSMLTFWADNAALNSIADAEKYLARLQTIPAGLVGILECLGEGARLGHVYSKIVVDRGVATLRAFLSQPVEQSSFVRPFLRSPVKSEEMARLKADCILFTKDQVVPALSAYTDYIEKELGARATDVLACSHSPIGRDLYRLMIELHTTESWSPDDVHQLGLDEVQRLNAEMLQIAKAAGHSGDLEGFRKALLAMPNQISVSADALRERIEILSKRIDSRMPEFFGRLPRMSYGVRSIPEALSPHMPPAYAQPNPADNSSAGVHWITSLPEKCPEYMHIPLALHEAWPGHLMHLALLQEMDLPDFRRHGGTRYTACLEGWALYCEWLGEDLGLYDTPERRYGRLEMEIWRACRLVVDTGIHAKGWTRVQAIMFMKQHMVQSEHTIEAEVDRYIGMPGQALAYQIGNRCIRGIRARSEARLGAAFQLRKFHDALMGAGAVTLPVLEEVMQEWEQNQLAAA